MALVRCSDCGRGNVGAPVAPRKKTSGFKKGCLYVCGGVVAAFIARMFLPTLLRASDSPSSNEESGDQEAQEGSEPPALNREAQKQWAEYARARFESAEDRVREFRNWARQLAAVLAVIIGLEVNLIVRVLDSASLLSDIYRLLLLLFLVGAAVFKAVLMFRIIPLGYSPHLLLGPESPTEMRKWLFRKDEVEAREIIARYYANACDGEEGIYLLAEKLGESLKRLARLSAISVSLLVLGVLIWAGGMILNPPSPYNSPTMAQQPKSPPPALPPKAPAPASPVKPPPLPTPTKGAPLHEGKK